MFTLIWGEQQHSRPMPNGVRYPGHWRAAMFPPLQRIYIVNI